MQSVFEPGGNLDAQIARKVLGWTLAEAEAEPLYDLDGQPVEGGPAWVDQDGEHRVWAWAWSPSQQIAHAWEVVEHLARHTLIKLEKHGSTQVDSDDEDWGWRVGIATGEGSEMLYRYAPTAPMAICRAALAVVDSEASSSHDQSYSI